MRKFTITLLVVAVLLTSAPGWAGDFGGTWNAEVTESQTACEDLGRDFVGQYVIEVFQSKDNLIVQAERPNVRYVGKLVAENPNAAHLQATYVKDGGYVTELVDMEFVDKNSAKGGVVWRWSDGVYACGGSYTFVLTKQ
ncbi:MAG: hypothetical protein OCC46_01840 [Pseudodesulfovibrio sp.]